MTATNDKTHHPLMAQFRRAAITVCKPSADPCVDDPWSDHLDTKSYAQVETLVRPLVRPKSCGLKPGRKRSHRLMGRFSEGERSIIFSKAEAVCLSINEYIRASALGADYKPPLDPELQYVLLAIHRELNRQGNNLNQIARHLNTNPDAAAKEDTALGQLIRSLRETQKAVQKALTQGRVIN